MKTTFVFLAMLFSLSPVRARSVFGEIRGTVTDPSGSVIAGASVTATNTATNESRKVVTDRAGDYSVLNLDAGTYEVLIEQGGFRKTLTKDVILRAREVARVDAHLEIQGTSTEVLVTGVAQVITTDQATIVDSKSAEQIQNLPVNFRAGTTNSVFYAISTAPGVQPSSTGGEFSLSGSMPFMATASVDGISSISVRSNGLLVEMFPSAEAIDEIKVSSVSNNAEFAQIGDVTTTSRGGTNAYHGSLYWYHQNGAFDAKDYFSVRNAAPFKVSNDFGGAFGGPIIHNKTFIFGDYEGLRYRALSQIQNIVPPDSYRTGNLSSVSKAIKDPTTGLNFTGNIIPRDRISPVSAKILELLYPRQNIAGDGISNNNFFLQLPAGNTNNQYDTRIDHIFNQKQNLFGRYSYKDVTTASPASLPVRGDNRENRTS
ncbi:MAG: carboxypeptidase-like regulatory domain-containing protein, partial [Acidobacteriota bacterium]|nr:carboxypeptidase-like regulatory domain-containing protein [Acidobacteriota bacterium]